jgi:putative ABC transport system substrate-binding protein
MPASQAFHEGLQQSGWIQGENLRIDYHWAQSADSVAIAVAELMALKLDAIVAETNIHTKALKAATATVPIVMALCSEPVKTGLVASLARPGGNITGVASLSAELTEKRLDLLKQTLPQAARIACLWNPEISGDAIDEAGVHAAASRLGLQAEILSFRRGQEITDAFTAASRSGIDAMVMLSDLLSPGAEALWASNVARTRLPVMSGNSEFVRAGCLLAYGPSLPGLFRRSAAYVDKILRGAKPADLPVEQPTEFDFIINVRNAQDLGLTIPPSVLQQTTEVIQ